MGPAWRPWPGLAEAGLSGEKKTDSPKAGIHFFSPLRISFFSPGKNGFISLQGLEPWIISGHSGPAGAAGVAGAAGAAAAGGGGGSSGSSGKPLNSQKINK